MGDKPSEDCLSGQHTSVADLPDFGWRVPFSYECKIKCQPFTKPRLKQIPQYVGLGLRYTKFWLGKKRQGRRPFIDQLNSTKHKPIYGCPLGGLGSGTIGRGYRGEFCRFQMVPGMYHYYEVDADQFIVCIRKQGKSVYQKVLSCGKKSKKKDLKSWDWSFPKTNGTYHALYPRAWSLFKIPEFGVTLVCRQISPVFPHDYLETSLPTAVFVWEVKNDSNEDLDISITFTFKNGQGTKEDRAGGVWCQGFSCVCDGDKTVQGVTINQEFNGMKCSYGIAAKATSEVDVTTLKQFNPKSDGSTLWQPLFKTGQLCEDISTEPSPPTSKGQEVASGVCAMVHVAKHSKGQCEFALSWDMPIIQFAAKENTYTRRYARLYGTEGNAAPQLCAHALRNYPMWESKIEAWQQPVLNSQDLPSWYKSALFNELYYLIDGGTIWIDVTDNSGNARTTHNLVKEYGRFAYLEGQEYRMFNTYDVHHYASFALLMLWPKLQLSLQYDYSDTVVMEDPARVKFLMSGEIGLRKVDKCVPHDVGDPEDEPWKRVNCYIVHPTDDWKDLNLKFILQSYRDFHATQNTNYLSRMYPICKCLIESSKVWDKDGDGVIENGGYADQTFDAWVMKGASSYCGGLWLACLRMMVEMARVLNLPEDEASFQGMLDKGKVSFNEKLWNGSYYDYDSSSSGHHDSVMADQLAGHWFLKATGLQDETIFPHDHVHQALQKIFNNNVLGFRNGDMGAVNGTRPDGSMDLSSPQSEEFWVGITYALAANMIQEGMVEEGFRTAYGAHHICWDVMGLHFQTPEAYTANLNYRSLAYMRPLAIWAIQWALERFHPNLMPSVCSLSVKSDESFGDGSSKVSQSKLLSSADNTCDSSTIGDVSLTQMPDDTVTPAPAQLHDTVTPASAEPDDTMTPVLAETDDTMTPVLAETDDAMTPVLAETDDTMTPVLAETDDTMTPALAEPDDTMIPAPAKPDGMVTPIPAQLHDTVTPAPAEPDDTMTPTLAKLDDTMTPVEPSDAPNDDLVKEESRKGD